VRPPTPPTQPGGAPEKGGSAAGPSAVDRGRLGVKHHLIVDACGLPLAYTTTPGNRNDVTQLVPLLDRIPAVAGRVGRPRRRPSVVDADRGYDHDKYRRQRRARGIGHRIARRGCEHGSGLGRTRWVVEPSFAWLHDYKRLAICYERRADLHEALLAVGCCLICWRRLQAASL
jgi:transposase